MTEGDKDGAEKELLFLTRPRPGRRPRHLPARVQCGLSHIHV